MANDLVETFSGVRGIWKKGLTDELALKYGLCFVELIKKQAKAKPCLIIGRDTRPSSKKIAELFKRAFSSKAKKIIDVGVMPIAAVELGIRDYKLNGGVMITASHSPKDFNGWKLLDKTGAIISPDFLRKVIAFRKKIWTSDVQKKIWTSDVQIFFRHQDLKKRYISFAHKVIGGKGLELIRQNRFKILVDPNGGAASVLINPLLEAFNVRGHYLNMEPGKFKREIEPTSQTLAYLRPIIKKQKAHFAVGFDCDGDRAEIVLGEDCAYTKKHGPVVNGQYLLAILTDEVLSKMTKPQGKIIVTNDCTSNLVRQTAQKYGAVIKEVETGEVNVVNEMLKQNSPIAGEGSSSGAIFPPAKCRDGILSLLVLLRHLAKKKKTLSQVLDEYPDFYSFREKVYCPPEKQIQVRENIKRALQKQGIKIQERGGKTGTVKALISPASFIFFRASKTEPGAFRIISDAPSKSRAEQLLEKGVKIFNQARNF